MSKIVPPAAKPTITNAKTCIASEGTVSASVENGFIEIIFFNASSTVELNNQ